MPKLLAFVPAEARDPTGAGAPLRYSGGWRAIPERGRTLLPMAGRRAALRDAERRMYALEGLMDHDVVLPCLPGTRIPTRDLEAAMSAVGPDLDRIAPRFQGRVQYQLTIRWDIDAAHVRFRDGPFPAGSDDDTLRRAFQDHAFGALTGCCDDLQALPVAPGCAVNLVLLLRRDAEAALDRALHGLDALWPEGLKLRLVGPTPPVSFCSVGFRKVPRSRVSAAAALLGMSPDADGAALAKARRAALKAQPEHAEVIRAAASLVERAQAVPARQPLYMLHTWAEGQAISSTALRGAA